MLEHRFAILLTLITFCLLLLGGVVHNTASSLACPDWPLCYGTLFPEMKGGVAIEHSHRLLAATVGLLTICLAVLLWKRGGDDPFLKRAGMGAVFLVILQGILGGITVLYRLPTVVSTAHLALSFFFFTLLVVIVWKTSPSPFSPPTRGRDIGSRSLRGKRFLSTTMVLVYLQSILGAFVRHSGAGLICPDIPFCNGSPWPVGLHPIFQLHMAHRWLAVFVALVLFLLAVFLWENLREIHWGRFLMGGAIFLVFLQITLGLLVIVTQKEIVLLTAHLGVAALLLGALVSLRVCYQRSCS